MARPARLAGARRGEQPLRVTDWRRRKSMPNRTTDENQHQPPPDDQDRIKDFFARHGGAGKTPQRFGGPQAGRQGWSEIEAGDGHVLRCDWSRSGSREEITYSEVAPAGVAPTTLQK
jgi:hypothetical protein